MQSFLTLGLILLPMFVGFWLPKSDRLSLLAQRGLTWLVYVILLVIGVELGQVPNLTDQSGQIVIYLLVLSALTLGCGTLCLFLFEKTAKFPYRIISKNTQSNTHAVKGSLVQVACLLVGFVLSRSLLAQMLLAQWLITALLMALLFLVGISLKASGVSLRQSLLNRYGFVMSMVFVASTLAGGLIFAGVFEQVSWSQGLALASGFGWYSLSGTVMTDAYGAVWGSVALFHDLGREILALIFIPLIMRISPTCAIGLGGVTSLDFTLPTLTQAGGVQIAPLVISFGFITNVVSPVLMVLFASFG